MAGGGSGTTKVEPPSYQLPYLQRGLQQAQNLYNDGPKTADFSDPTKYAQEMIQMRAANGDPNMRQAGNVLDQTLNGGFLNNNPYLDANFEKQRLATQNGLTSEYARAGRNIDASAPVRADQLNNLANSVYGQNYANERQLMQGALGYVPQFANQAYVDAEKLGAVGAQMEAKDQEKMDAQGLSLDQYLARVRGSDYGSTQKQKTPGNPLGGALGGAAAGSMFGPWGSLIGGGLGAIFG